jgi:hypothetical protein
MNKLYNVSTILSVVILISSCVPPVKPQKASLELQAFQSKEFETSKKTAFASVLSVFQDLGYIIGSADLETGFISAKSPTKRTNLFLPPIDLMEDTKATAFIEEIRKNVTKVRLNFVNSTEESTRSGQISRNEVPVEDPQTYQNAFSKIQEGIFIRESTK